MESRTSEPVALRFLWLAAGSKQWWPAHPAQPSCTPGLRPTLPWARTLRLLTRSLAPLRVSSRIPGGVHGRLHGAGQGLLLGTWLRVCCLASSAVFVPVVQGPLLLRPALAGPWCPCDAHPEWWLPDCHLSICLCSVFGLCLTRETETSESHCPTVFPPPDYELGEPCRMGTLRQLSSPSQGGSGAPERFEPGLSGWGAQFLEHWEFVQVCFLLCRLGK